MWHWEIRQQRLTERIKPCNANSGKKRGAGPWNSIIPDWEALGTQAKLTSIFKTKSMQPNKNGGEMRKSKETVCMDGSIYDRLCTGHFECIFSLTPHHCVRKILFGPFLSFRSSQIGQDHMSCRSMIPIWSFSFNLLLLVYGWQTICSGRQNMCSRNLSVTNILFSCLFPLSKLFLPLDYFNF